MRKFGVCFKGLMRQLHPIRWRVRVSVLVGLLQVAVSLAFVAMSKTVVDIATGQSDAPLGKNVAFFVGVMAVQVALRVFARYWENYTVVLTQNNTRRSVFEKVLRSTWDGRDRFHSGDTVNRLEEDIRVIVDFICVSLPDLLVTVTQLIAASIYLFVLSPGLAWILVWIMPVAIVGSRLFFRKMRRLTNEIRADDSRIQSHMQENIQQKILVRTMGCTDNVLDRMDDLQTSVKRKSVTRMNYSAVSRTFVQLGFASGYALAFLWGIYGLKDGSVTYGLMVAFLQIVGQVQRPVAEITRQIPAFIRALSSQDRLFDLMDMEQEEDDGSNILLEGAPGVVLTDVSFQYPESDKLVLDTLSYDFKPGTMTAILGPTGAGKSTLVKLVMALLKPSQGSVELYDGKQKVSSQVATRCNFMYVPQGNSLMSGTIRQNMQLADPDATDEQIGAVLHLAAADFVFELKNGLDTKCSEIGRGLSEGQAQRIAIARALLRPGGILILDECTSALDADTEQQLLQRLHDHYHNGKTILCITHRPAATTYADSILRI